MRESPTAAGSTEVAFSVESDTVLLTLYAGSVAGDLSVSVWTFTDTGKEALLFNFPVVSAPTTNLILKRAAITLQRVLIRATYTDACDFEIYARAIQSGLVDTRIVGAANLRMSQVDITSGAAQLLLAASLTDRAGIVVKNWSGAGTVYLGATAAEATVAAGYPLGAKDALAVDLASGQAVWAVADAGTVDVRISEAGN